MTYEKKPNVQILPARMLRPAMMKQKDIYRTAMVANIPLLFIKDRSRGVITAGMENGELALWDPAKIIAQAEFINPINSWVVAHHCVVSLALPNHSFFVTRFTLDPSTGSTSTQYKPIFCLLVQSAARSVPTAFTLHIIISLPCNLI